MYQWLGGMATEIFWMVDLTDNLGICGKGGFDIEGEGPVGDQCRGPAQGESMEKSDSAQTILNAGPPLGSHK